MVRSKPNRSRTQLVLELDRRHLGSPVAPRTKGLIEALADLLLEALGSEATKMEGGDNEQ